MLIDTHCHLDFDDFAPDFDAVLARAVAAGVGGLVTISTSLKTFPRVRAAAARGPQLFCTVGVHPHTAEAEQVDAATLIQLADDPKVVGIGETGLDYYYDTSPRQLQQANFRAHIHAARATQLPLIVHARDADADTMDMLEQEHRQGAFPGLIHCFTASRALAERALAIGFYISISGIITFKTAASLRDTVRDVVPPERLLVETDAPYLAPIPHRGQRNEPAFVANTARAVAALKGLSAEELAQITTANARRVFSKAQFPDVPFSAPATDG
jgi:TatD DNase family protein